MNVPTNIASPQELIIIYKLISEGDSIILAFTYESQNLVLKILKISIQH